MSDLRLRSYHELSGALFRQEAGWEVPSTYGPLHEEVRAVRQGSGVIDLSDRAKVQITGPDRVSFLDGLLTADVKSLAPRTSAYALLLTDKSKVVGDLRISVEEDRIFLDIDAAEKDAIIAHIQKFLVSDDVTLADLRPCGHLEVHGPSSASVVSRALGFDARPMSLNAVAAFSPEKGQRGYATHVRTLDEDGFVIWAPGASLAPTWSALVRFGASPFGRDAHEVLRIEAGIPRVGADMTLGTLALEVAPEGAISFTKGCYVGQEVVARGTYRGHINRKLMGLVVDGDVPPSRGDAVRRLDQEVGHITSGTWSPTLSRVIALALLRFEDVTPEMTLFIDHGGWDLRARLHPLPFVRGSA